MMSSDNPNVDPGGGPGVSESGKRVASAAMDWVGGITELATLEIRYSLRSATAALVAGLVLAATLFAAWALVLITITVALTEIGVTWIWALLLVNFINLILALGLWIGTGKLIERIGLNATRHALGLAREPDRTTNHAESQPAD